MRNILRNWSPALAAEAKGIIEAGDEAAKLSGGIAKNYTGQQWALCNTWRPLKPVKRDPLACVDYASGKDARSVVFWREIPGINGPFPVDAPLTLASLNFDWYWLSDQQPNEVLVIKIFNSKNERHPDDVAGGVHNSSFHLPVTDGEEVRESIETKFFAFW